MTLYIQQIDIDNFKSFSGKTTIPFQTGFTTISGPNGSGKSNIIDSILFCLGLSTSRTLRAEKLTDLINHSSRRREASVTISFTDDTSPDQPKFIVSRAVRDNRQSGYSSTYYLNGKVTTLTEIQDLLSQNNISAHAYNVLMQGDVTGIINMTPYERRKIIDELAGVSEFDRKTDQAQREIETVAAGIERSNILRDELHSRVEQLKADRELALKYQSLRDEKVKLEGQVKLATYKDLKDRLRLLEQSIRNADKEKKAQEDSLKALQESLQQTEADLREISAEVKRKGEDQQIALKKQIEGLKGAISRKQDSIRFGQEKRAENIDNIKKAQDEIERLKAKQNDLKTASSKEEDAVKTLEKKLADQKESYDKAFAELNALNEQTAAIAEQQNALQQQLRQAEDELARKKREQLDLQAEKERLIRDKALTDTQLGDKQARLATIEAKLTQLELDAKTAEIDASAFRSQLEKKQLDVSKARVALNDANARVNEVYKEVTRLEAQKRAYDDVNLGRSVDAILNSGLPGIHGTLAQLMTVEGDVALALETALGGRIRSIVVDTDRTAQDAIELLKRLNAGRATFLPMNKMKSYGKLPLLPDDEAILGYAIDLAQFDSRFDTVFAYAFGETVVFESMQAARKYIGKYRMVTLDGSIFEKTGAMTGGSPQRQNSGLLMSGKIEQDIKGVQASLKTLEAEKNQAADALAKLEISFDRLKQDAAEAGPKAQEARFAFDAMSREKQELLNFLNTASQGSEGHQADTKRLDEALKAAEAEISAIEKRVSQLSNDLKAAESKLPAEALAALKKQQDELDQAVRAVEAELRHAQGELQAKTLENEFMEKGIDSYTSQIESMKQASEASEKEAKQFAEEIVLIEQQIAGLIDQANLMDKELVALQAKRDEVQALLIEKERQKFTLQQALASFDEQLAAYDTRRREIRPELEALKRELTEAGQDLTEIETMTIESIETIQKTLLSIQRKMDALGDVNMRAIADYDEVQSRLSELSEKLDTLDREKNDLQVKIQGYADLKLKTFRDAFENVNIHFKEIFADLSDGEGQLILTNPENPFDGGLTIEAKPRGKKTLRLESMSGGEKSLTALAFVFAFQRHLPAPFYAFDEVDMFLDGINAEKLAHMVKKQAGNAQFIVVSLRKPMLQNSDLTVGVTQMRDGISKVTGVDLKDAS